MPIIHHFPIKVIETDLDELNHVNNIVYLRYVQEAAGSHWFSTISPKIASELLWVVRRHEIDYLKPALLNDDLVVKTWVDNFTGVTSDRHCEICRGDEILARSRTLWVAVDAKTMKPKRVSADIAEKF